MAIVNLWWLGLTLSSPWLILSGPSPILGRNGGEGDGGREEGGKRRERGGEVKREGGCKRRGGKTSMRGDGEGSEKEEI